MTDDISDNLFEGKNEPADWFDAIKDIFETPSVPKEWVDYLHKIYAYLDIGSLSDEAKEMPVSLSKIPKSGWTLHDYGNHIAVSSGDYAHGFRESDKVDDNASPGYGTIVAQSWNSAQKLVELARQRWPQEAHLIGGTPFMQFAAGYWAWLANYEIFGLAIHKSDELAYGQIKNLLGQADDLTSEQRPK
jgi:hypothetical protein